MRELTPADRVTLAKAGTDLEAIFDVIDGKLVIAQRTAMGGGRSALLEARSILTRLRHILAEGVARPDINPYAEGDR